MLNPMTVQRNVCRETPHGRRIRLLGCSIDALRASAIMLFFGEEFPLMADVAPSLASFFDTLRQLALLKPEQLNEISLQRDFPDSPALGKELIRRGWLTPYQVNQLLQHKGSELLVGPYVLVERLGAGGAGQVFK